MDSIKLNNTQASLGKLSTSWENSPPSHPQTGQSPLI
ncbi:hypothetical protein A2U01_0055800, partial [Trifolium medium]|nr:hypothetical protein [Trifolium medium]